MCGVVQCVEFDLFLVYVMMCDYFVVQIYYFDEIYLIVVWCCVWVFLDELVIV